MQETTIEEATEKLLKMNLDIWQALDELGHLVGFCL